MRLNPNVHSSPIPSSLVSFPDASFSFMRVQTLPRFTFLVSGATTFVVLTTPLTVSYFRFSLQSTNVWLNRSWCGAIAWLLHCAVLGSLLIRGVDQDLDILLVSEPHEHFHHHQILSELAHVLGGGARQHFHPWLGAGARIWRYFWYINIVDVFLISYTNLDMFQVVGLGNSFHPMLGAIQQGIKSCIYLYLVFPIDRAVAV